MSRRIPLISPVSLRELYVELGSYSAKFLVDPKRSQLTEIREVLVIDSDGRPMAALSRRWGTKLHVTFTIDESTPDGVSLIDFILADGTRSRHRFWVVK